MSLSWFGFGNKKKAHDSEPEQASEVQGDEYVFIERRSYVPNDGTTVPGPVPYPPVLPYSVAPASRIPPESNVVNTVNASQPQNFLYGVPFKLSADTTNFTQDSIDINRIHANEVLSHISQLNLKSFDYDFQIERSVVLEIQD